VPRDGDHAASVRHRERDIDHRQSGAHQQQRILRIDVVQARLGPRVGDESIPPQQRLRRPAHVRGEPALGQNHRRDVIFLPIRQRECHIAVRFDHGCRRRDRQPGDLAVGRRLGLRPGVLVTQIVTEPGARHEVERAGVGMTVRANPARESVGVSGVGGHVLRDGVEDVLGVRGGECRAAGDAGVWVDEQNVDKATSATGLTQQVDGGERPDRPGADDSDSVTSRGGGRGFGGGKSMSHNLTLLN
jgi:hypothetical protein